LRLKNTTPWPVGLPRSNFSLLFGISISVPMSRCGRPSGASGLSSVMVAKVLPSRTWISSAQ
jgi:hypothetical protein